MPHRQRNYLIAAADKKSSPTTSALTCCSASAAKAASMSRSLLASTTAIVLPNVLAAARTLATSNPDPGYLGFTSSPIIDVRGASSCRSCRRFPASSVVNMLTPVAFPPGLLRLATKPNLTGSSPTIKTMASCLSRLSRPPRRRCLQSLPIGSLGGRQARQQIFPASHTVHQPNDTEPQ